MIGSETYGLSGVNSDVALMASTLERRGFQVRTHIDGAATRAGIIEAYERLIAETSEGSTEPVVVYYSGHGGRNTLEDAEERAQQGASSHLHFIVPFDMEASTEADFRGILAQELSDLQRRLTERTPNVTTILDCCHSATMSRDPSIVPKSVSRGFSVKGARAWLEEYEARRQSQPDLLDTSNQLAVRVVACDPTQSAYERTGAPTASVTGRSPSSSPPRSTDSVSGRSAGESWASASGAPSPPRCRCSARRSRDRPTASSSRSARARGPGHSPSRSAAARPRSRPRRSSGSPPVTPTRCSPTTRPRSVRPRSPASSADRAELEVTDGSADSAVSAIPTRSHNTQPVRIDVAGDAAGLVDDAVQRSSSLRADAAATPIATITDADGLVVLDPDGRAVNARPLARDATGAGQAVEAAERIAKAIRLRSMTSSLTQGAELAGTVTAELVTYDAGGRTARQAAGERLYVGDRVGITITNATDRTMYVAVLDVRPSYEVVMLSSDEPAGWKMGPGDVRVLGGDDGASLSWNPDVPADESRLESIVVIAATAPQDFGLLQTGGAKSRGSAPSELEAMLGEARSGTRDFPTAAATQGAPAIAYRVTSLDFDMVPSARPDLDEPAFSIREVPDVSMRLLQPRALAEPPKRLRRAPDGAAGAEEPGPVQSGRPPRRHDHHQAW